MSTTIYQVRNKVVVSLMTEAVCCLRYHRLTGCVHTTLPELELCCSLFVSVLRAK